MCTSCAGTRITRGEFGSILQLTSPLDEVSRSCFCAAHCIGWAILLPSRFAKLMCWCCRCLSDSDPECTLCARQHSIVREVRRNQTRLADRHDLFINEVREADEGFGVVAGAFGRGLMDRPVQSDAVV